jgi:peptidyl-prolyl cis-trans isomerase A (cyclophilin A)/peptidyl-prolyl cis-trans isomerase B (cyclophilin B)
MLKRALLLLALSMPAFALAQTGTPAKPAPKAPAKTAPAKPAAAKKTPEAAPAADAAKTPVASKVLIKTSLGDMTVELYPDKSPKSVENFLTYVNSGFYDGTIFHRVIDNFMIQGGGFTRELRQKPTRPAIPNEAKNGLSNTRGTLAMARTGDPNSATAQFFINVVDNPRLDFTSEANGATWGYTVFGKVVSGLEVVDKIKAVPTGPQGPFKSDVPTTPVVIEKITVIK